MDLQETTDDSNYTKLELDSDEEKEIGYMGILAIAVPASLSSILFFSIEIMNLMFIGYLNDPAMVAAIGLGNMTINFTCFSIILGLNSALQTLVSQASGAG